MFHVERSERDNFVVLTLSGNLDAMTSAALKNEVIALTESGKLRVVVDLSRLRLVDSTGVGVLISLFKRARARDGAVQFVGLNGQPKEIFRLLRLDRSLDLSPNLDEALQKLRLSQLGA